MYSGYELSESAAVREGSEEYLDSEKYQSAPGLVEPGVPRTFHHAAQRDPQRPSRRDRTDEAPFGSPHDDDSMLLVSRSTPTRRMLIILVVNPGPSSSTRGQHMAGFGALGLAADRPFEVHDELGGETYTWHGAVNYVRLDPVWLPAHVLQVRQQR